MVENFAQFSAMAGLHHGTAKAFSQTTWMTRVCDDFGKLLDVRNGICRALSAAYLVRNHTRQAEKDDDFLPDIDRDVIRRFGPKNFFTAFDDSKPSGLQGASDKTRFDKMHTAQTRFSRDGPFSREEAVEAAVKTVKLLSNGLMKKTRDWSVLHISKGVDAAAIQSPGFWYMSAGKHAMAAVFRHPKAKFFDPNYGQIVFDSDGSAATLARFMTAYFRDQGYDQIEMIQFA